MTKLAHQKIPMRRQDRQDVKRWLARLHPFVNKRHNYRSGGWLRCIERYSAFPTNEAAVRRFFAWCDRHGRKPDRLSRCLYWGLCEPSDEGAFSSGPIFRGFSPAIIENLIGGPTRWLVQRDRVLDRTDIMVYKDRYRMVMRVVDEKGRCVYKTHIDVNINSMELFGYDNDTNKRHSVSGNIKVSFVPKVVMGYKFNASTVLNPSDSNADFNDAVHCIVGSEVRAYIGRNWKAEIQPYQYRSRKSINRANNGGSRRRNGRW